MGVCKHKGFLANLISHQGLTFSFDLILDEVPGGETLLLTALVSAALHGQHNAGCPRIAHLHQNWNKTPHRWVTGTETQTASTFFRVIEIKWPIFQSLLLPGFPSLYFIKYVLHLISLLLFLPWGTNRHNLVVTPEWHLSLLNTVKPRLLMQTFSQTIQPKLYWSFFISPSNLLLTSVVFLLIFVSVALTFRY